jgi:hypothetical protein
MSGRQLAMPERQRAAIALNWPCHRNDKGKQMGDAKSKGIGDLSRVGTDELDDVIGEAAEKLDITIAAAAAQDAGEVALEFARRRRRAVLAAAEGLWRNRTDVPKDGVQAQEELRAEWH